MNMYDVCLLHARSDRSLRAAIAAQLEESQITMMEWLLLGVVSAGSPKGSSMSDIAKTLHVTLPQVTALVNKLLPLKLIKQKSANIDRRSRLVLLTTKGVSVFQDSSALLNAAQNDILQNVSEDEIQVYIKVLEQISSLGRSENQSAS